MKAIIVIEIDENHLLKEMNELYDRLNGYKCDLKPMPEKLQFQEPFNDDYTVSWASRLGFVDGWNACLDEIIGETE